jgi:hypothetical protein
MLFLGNRFRIITVFLSPSTKVFKGFSKAPSELQTAFLKPLWGLYTDFQEGIGDTPGNAA